MAIATDDLPNRRRGIQSVEIGMRVLDALATLDKAASLSAIAQAAGMSASQAHRYLVSLLAAGMVRQDAATSRYDLGPAALRIGLGALARIDALRATDAAVSAFAERTGRTVQIAALGPLGPTIVRWAVGRPPVMTSFNIGSVLPLLRSATGMVFLAFAPEGLIAHLVDRERAEREGAGIDVDALRAKVRKAGRAHVDGTMVPGLHATAFPVRDLQGAAILSATAITSGDGGEHARVTDDELGETCRALSAGLGWREDDAGRATGIA